MTGRLDPHGELPPQRRVDEDGDAWLAVLDQADPTLPLVVDVGDGPVEYDTWGVTAWPIVGLGRGVNSGGFLSLWLWRKPQLMGFYVGGDNIKKEIPGLVVKYRLANVRGLGQSGVGCWQTENP